MHPCLFVSIRGQQSPVAVLSRCLLAVHNPQKIQDYHTKSATSDVRAGTIFEPGLKFQLTNEGNLIQFLIVQ